MWMVQLMMVFAMQEERETKVFYNEYNEPCGAKLNDDTTFSMENRLAKVGARIDHLNSGACQFYKRSKETWSVRLRAFSARYDSQRQKMEGVASKSGAAWCELKTGMKAAWQDLHSAWDKASHKFH